QFTVEQQPDRRQVLHIVPGVVAHFLELRQRVSHVIELPAGIFIGHDMLPGVVGPCYEHHLHDNVKLPYRFRSILVPATWPFVVTFPAVRTHIARVASSAHRRPGGVVGLPTQQIARLAFQHLAQRSEGGETHGLGTAVLEHRQVGGRDADVLGQRADGHLAAGQHDIDVHQDGHQITSSSSDLSCLACESSATACASNIRSTSTISATPAITSDAPQTMAIRPGAISSPGVMRLACAATTAMPNVSAEAAAMAPITMST